MWAAVNAAGATTSIALEWNAGATGFLMDGVAVSDQSVSASRPAYLTSTPPTESLGSWYQAGVTGDSNILFSITCPGGTLIQIDYDWVMNSGEPNVSATGYVIVGGTQGNVYAQNPSATIQVALPINSIS